MSNLFNLQRFGRLFRKHTAEHLREYLLGAAVLFGLQIVLMGALSYLQSSSMNVSVQGLLFGFGMLGAGTFFTSLVFQQFGAKNRAIAALCLPASHLEKYLVGWLYSFVIFLLVYIPVFYLANGIVLLLFNTPERHHEAVNVFAPDQDTFASFYFYAFLHAVALIGAIFFEKAQFVKTAFVAFAGIAMVGVLNFWVLKALFGRDLMLALPFSNLHFQTAHEYFTLELPAAQRTLVGLLFAGLTVLFWGVAYARLQEKQV